MPSAFSRTRQLCLRIVEYALDTIAPPDPLIRSIERMTPGEFASRASLAPQSPEGAVAFFSYKDPLVKAAVLEVKSYGNRRVARTIGRAAADLLAEELADLASFKAFSSPVLVPVPLTRKSLRRRGWNQCELLAREIADRGTGLELRTDVLQKTRETGDQVGKSRPERFANLRGCFSVEDPEKIRGRNAIVLDDIVTTGATLSEARRALGRAGARKVLCVAICG